MTARKILPLIFSLNYYPESTGIAPYSTKLAEGLVRLGGRVNVISGYPHYPEWRVHAGYRGLTKAENINNVAVRRLRHFVPSRVTTLARIAMEVTYGIRAVLTPWPKCDVVVTVSPSLFASCFIVLKARLLGIPVGVWVQDIYSRGLEETSQGGSLSVRIARKLEGALLRSATGVSVIHHRFLEYVVSELGIPQEKVVVTRNWSHLSIPEHVDVQATRRRLLWDEGEIIALHAGNMGVKQDLENLIAAARLATDRATRVRFVLMGNGNRRETLERAATGVRSISFVDSLPAGLFEDALASADILLVNEKPGVREMSVPSKLTTYFAAAKPIIAATEPDSATADEVRASGAGIQVPPGQPAALLDAIESLAKDPDAVSRYGSAGLPYAKRVLDESQAIRDHQDWLNTLV